MFLAQVRLADIVKISPRFPSYSWARAAGADGLLLLLNVVVEDGHGQHVDARLALVPHEHSVHSAGTDSGFSGFSIVCYPKV